MGITTKSFIAPSSVCYLPDQGSSEVLEKVTADIVSDNISIEIKGSGDSEEETKLAQKCFIFKKRNI